MELLAKVISASLLERLEEGRVYSVHSRFSHGINMEAEGRLSFIGNKENEILPYGILVSSGELAALHSLLEGDEILWREGCLVTKRGSLRINGARVFSNALPACLQPAKNISIPEFPECAGLQTGLGESIGNAKYLLEEKKVRLTKAIINGTNLEHELAGWIGAGPGLTPSGDDYLTGVLAADWMHHFSCPEFRTIIKKLADGEYTTDIGANQLICAAEGEFSSSWIGFINAYSMADDMEMKKHLIGILKYGHTSGRDMFAGFLMGLAMAKCGVEYGE